MTTTPTATLLLIDVQNDFHPGGSLAIPTANEDAQRIVTFVQTCGTKIHRIVATMDTHPLIHIGHSKFWINPDNNQHPNPFTIITTNDIINKKWKPRSDLYITATDIDPTIFTTSSSLNIYNKDGSIDLESYCIEYTKRLEKQGKFQLCIWPEHCIEGSYGHGIVPIVHDALKEWTARTGRNVEYVCKGQTIVTEMYSALCAEVPTNTATSFNTELKQSLRTSSTVLFVAGQAMSHCVNYTLRDLMMQTNDNEDQQRIEKQRVVLLTDCASAVPGFEKDAEQFQTDMKTVGVECVSSTDVLF